MNPIIAIMPTAVGEMDTGEQQQQQQQQQSSPLDGKNVDIDKANKKKNSSSSSAHSVATTAATSLSGTTISFNSTPAVLSAGHRHHHHHHQLVSSGGWRTLSNENDNDDDDDDESPLLLEHHNAGMLFQNVVSSEQQVMSTMPISNAKDNSTKMGQKSKVVPSGGGGSGSGVRMMNHQLQFSSLKKLYGREKEIQLLYQALERTVVRNNSKKENNINMDNEQLQNNEQTQQKTEVVMVSGYSGTGKSALVMQLQEPCHNLYHGCFCFGKYDLQDRCLPFSAISTALCRLVEDIHATSSTSSSSTSSRRGIDGSSNDDCRFKDQLRPKLDALLGHQGEGEEHEVLKAVIPNLHLLLLPEGEGDDTIEEQQQQQHGEIIIPASLSSSSFVGQCCCDTVGSCCTCCTEKKKAKLQLLLRIFMKEVCKVYCPVVLHLDDLQWADSASLDLLRALVMDRDISGLMVVGCYRDNEVIGHDDHKLFTLFLNHLNNKGHHPTTTTGAAAPAVVVDGRRAETNNNNNNNTVSLTTISVHNLDQTTIKSMLQDLLQMNHSSDNDVETLARVVHTKTFGNIFFVIQFLKTLQQMELLTFNDDNGDQFECWQWDKDEIAQNKMIAHITSDNVAELMTLDIEKQLSIPAQNALKIAACLGNECEESMLVLLLIKMSSSEEKQQHDDIDIDQGGFFVWDDDDGPSTITDENQARQLLEQCVQGGFLYRQSCNNTGEQHQHQQRVVSYRFVHDVVQEAAISLIGQQQQDLAHYHIGKVLVENLPANVQEQNLFVLVDMMNHGMKVHALKQTRSLLINLNLKAGKKALQSSAFEAAVQYITISVRMLGHDCWDESNYATTLDLFSTAAQAEFCNANPDKCKWYIDRVLSQTTHHGSIQDKFRVYTCLIDYYNFHEKHSDALSTSIMVMKQLGVDFGPPTLLPVATVSSLLKTKRLLRNMTADDMLGLPPMRDKTKRMAMRLMDRALTSSYLLNSPYFPMIEYKMVRWSIKHGLCPQSATAFATYGLLLAGAMGKLEEARLMGKVAEELSKRPGWRETRCRIIMLTNNYVFPWTSHVRSCLKPLLSGYELGMKEGDLENAFFCACDYAKLSICAGRPLHLIHADILAFTAQMKVYSQEYIYQMCLPHLQLVLNLMSESAPEPPLLSGEIMVYDEMMKHLVDTNHAYLQDATRLNQLQLAFYFGDYQLAWDMVEDSKNFETTNVAHVTVWRRTFFAGMTAFSLARISNSGIWKRRGRKAIAQLKKWMKGGNVNCIHLLHLLMAEEEALFQGDYMFYHESLMDAEFGCEILLEAGIVPRDMALVLFQRALSRAARAGFIHDAALAAERTAEYLSIGLSSCDSDHAAKGRVCEYLDLAITSYTEWGAFAKVDQLKHKWASWFQLECTECSELGSDDIDYSYSPRTRDS